MLHLDGVYADGPDRSLCFRWVKALSSAQITPLTQTLARRIGRHLERQDWLAQDADNGDLAGDVLEASPVAPLLGSSIAYRVTWVAAGSRGVQTTNADSARRRFFLPCLVSFAPNRQAGIRPSRSGTAE